MASTSTSRYDPQSTATGGSAATDSRSTGSTAGATTGTTNGTQTQNASTQNMDPSSLAALQTLIAQLLGGGTQAMAKDAAARKGEINTVQGQRAGYSKDAAFADAQGLMAQTMRRVMEQLIPSISRSAEGAGASQSSLRALLLQDAASKAAESASAQGLQAAQGYGQISTNMSQVLEALTRPDNSVTNALIQALGVAKGAVQNTNSVTQTTGQTSGTSQAQESKNVDYAPFAPIKVGGGLTYFGPTQSDSDAIMSSRGQNETNLRDLLNSDVFSGFKF